MIPVWYLLPTVILSLLAGISIVNLRINGELDRKDLIIRQQLNLIRELRKDMLENIRRFEK
jgi:hypothetical protein